MGVDGAAGTSSRVGDVAPQVQERIRAVLAAPGAGWARRHLSTDVVGWLTSRSADGRLQSSPISFLWDGETVLFYSQPDTPKLRNIAADPSVSFHLSGDRYGDHALIFEGVACVDVAAQASNVHPSYRAKYRMPLSHWRMDEDKTATDFSVPIRIRPLRARAW